MNRPHPISAVLGALAGVAFAVLLFVSVAVVDPLREGTNQEFTDWWSDSGNQGASVLSMYTRLLAVPFFLVFLAQVRAKLRGNEEHDWNGLVFGAGIAFATAVAISAIFRGVIAQDVRVADQPLPAADTLRFATMLSYQTFGLAAMSLACVMIAATSVVVFQARVFARWLAWLGAVVALGTAVAVVALAGGLAIPLLLIWVLGCSFELIRTRQGQQETIPSRAALGPAGDIALER